MIKGKAPPSPRAEALLPWVGPVLVVVVGTIMLCWSWRTWPDVFVDFGRELYVPWRLAEGQTLYTDIAYFNGPLSPYANALFFRVFGTSLLTLAVCNIALLAGFVGLLYRMLAEVADRFAATAASLVFVTIFAFGQYVSIGNYNFVCPYSHEATHGVMLAFVSVFCLWLHHRRGGLRYMAASGISLGLVFLTKVEVFAAAGAAVASYLLFMLYVERPGRSIALKWGAVLLGCAAAPPVLAFALLSLAMPARDALGGTLGAWRWVFNDELTSLRFYRSGMGLDDPGANARAMLVWTGWYAAVIGPPTVVGLVLRKNLKRGLLTSGEARQKVKRFGAAAACLMIIGGVFGTQWRTIPWLDAARPLPLIMLALAVVYVTFLLVRHRELPGREQLILALSMTLLALVLLAKMFLRARVYHYGFVLAMPATLLLVVVLVTWLPALIARLGGYGGIVRASSAAVLVFAIAGHLRYVDARFQRKVHRVGQGADTIRADNRGMAAQALLDAINRRRTPNRTLVVLPEGVMVNYLARSVNPTPYSNFMPPELIMFSEEAMLNALRQHPPDLIAVVHKDTSEYGFRYFGRDYGREIMAWVRRNYRNVALIGAPPLQDGRFGILLLERSDLASDVLLEDDQVLRGA